MEEFIASLGLVRDALKKVPNGPVALSEIQVLDICSGGGTFARVVAPEAIQAAEVVVLGGLTRTPPGRPGVVATLSLPPEHSPDGIVRVVLDRLVHHTTAVMEVHIPDIDGSPSIPAIQSTVRLTAAGVVEILATLPADATAGTSIVLLEVAVAGVSVSLCTPRPTLMAFIGPADVTPDHAAQLQAWVGGKSHPGAWEEVYRATRDGFGSRDYHAKVDGKPRLLVLVREQARGWLFGGYTAVGSHVVVEGRTDNYEDRDAFVFTLINSQGLPPQRFRSLGKGRTMCTHQSSAAYFYGDTFALRICDGSDKKTASYSCLGDSCGEFGFERSVEGGPFILVGSEGGWLVAEMVAFVVPE